MLIEFSDDFIKQCIAKNFLTAVEDIDLSEYNSDAVIESLEWFISNENPRYGFDLSEFAKTICQNNNSDPIVSNDAQKTKRIDLLRQLPPEDLATFLDNITNCCHDLGRGEEDVCNSCLMRDGCGKSIETIEYLEAELDSADPKSIISFPREDQ